MDITTVWDVAASRGDFLFVAPDLVGGNDLRTAVFISLFTDRTAGPDDVIPDGTKDPRGWWGDQGQDQAIGSKLWLIRRAKQTPRTLAQAKEYCREALKWMIDDGVASAIDVETEWTRPGMLGVSVVLHRLGGRVDLQFETAWAGEV